MGALPRGENYWNGGRRDLRDPIPTIYEETIARNVREQEADARRGIANRLVCRGARIGTGLAVRGEEVRSNGAAAVDAWLRRTRLRPV